MAASGGLARAAAISYEAPRSPRGGMVDATDSKSVVERRVRSSRTGGTRPQEATRWLDQTFRGNVSFRSIAVIGAAPQKSAADRDLPVALQGEGDRSA